MHARAERVALPDRTRHETLAIEIDVTGLWFDSSVACLQFLHNRLVGHARDDDPQVDDIDRHVLAAVTVSLGVFVFEGGPQITLADKRHFVGKPYL